MSAKSAKLKHAVHTILNDVIEQCFKHLIHHPQNSDELNKVIKDATDEISYLVIKIDAHNMEEGSTELEEYYDGISKDLHSKSLLLLSKLQQIQKSRISSVSGE